MSNPVRWIIIITIIYIIILITLFVTGIIENNYLVNILISFAAGLIAWLITQTWVDWLRKDEKAELSKMYLKLNKHADKDFPPHKEDTNHIKEDTKRILKLVQEKELHLIEKKRMHMQKEFYDTLYKDMTNAKISGIAMVIRIRSITQAGDNDPLINSLINNTDVNVQILFSHPDSEFVKQRDIVEGKYSNKKNPCSKAILENIELLMKFAKENKSMTFKARSNLTIRMSKIAFPMAITYVTKNTEKDYGPETLLMGLILYNDLGNNLPMFQVPVDKINTSLYSNCIECFDKIFNDSEDFTLFSWNDEGPKIDPFGKLESVGFFENHSLSNLR